jgi:KaiC/GvpD/RAD55 family RecA-like ATPase
VTRVYRYGLLPPTVGGDVVDEQIRGAHKYQNKLIEIEKARRERSNRFFSERGLSEIEQRVEVLLAELAEHRDQIKASHVDARTPKTDPVDSVTVESIKKRLKEARRELNAERKRIASIPSVLQWLEANNEESNHAAKAARAECGVYWGTYLLAEQAAEAARKGRELRYQRWTGDGAVAVQLQNGLAVSDALGCADTRVVVDLIESSVPARGGKPLPRLRLRVGSEGRDPVWAEWPLIYHRSLPDGRLKWVKVVRRRVASKYHWSAHFVCEEGERRDDAGPSCYVDLRWSPSVTGSAAIRVAEVISRRGRHVVALDPAIRSVLAKADSLRAIRDRRLNELKADALPLFAGLALPEEWVERTRHLGQWRSPGRWAALAIWWRSHRVDDDGAFYEMLEAWRHHDKHLWEWEVNARRKAIARRRNDYRVVAAQLAREHGSLVIEKIDLSKLAKRKDPEEGERHNSVSQRQRVEVAPSEMRAAVLNAFEREGRAILLGPACANVDDLVTAHREGRCGERSARPARSNRFKRIRGISIDDTDAGGENETPLAKVVLSSDE